MSGRTSESESSDPKILMENQLLGIGKKVYPNWNIATPLSEEKQPNLEPLYEDISNLTRIRYFCSEDTRIKFGADK